MANNIIETRNNTKGHKVLFLNDKKVAYIAVTEKGHKMVLYIAKRAGEDLTVYNNAFKAKNTKKTMRADVVKINPTYANTKGKDSYFAKIDFPKTADLEAICNKLAEIAEKSGNYAPAETPSTEVEAPEAEATTENA